MQLMLGVLMVAGALTKRPSNLPKEFATVEHHRRWCNFAFFALRAAGVCINGSYYCDNITDCSDGSDEADPGCGVVSCSAGQVACATTGQCIPEGYVCDNVSDCTDGSDESEATCGASGCASGEWECNNGVCIPDNYLCDGIYDDCGDGSDETNCGNQTCTGFTCNNGNCIPYLWRCDGDNDCGDSSDESAAECG